MAPSPHHHDQPPYLVLMEDLIIHTDTHPFCPDPSCPCHVDQELLSQVDEAVKAVLLTPDEATLMIQGHTL